jgi:hypothetical protein
VLASAFELDARTGNEVGTVREDLRLVDELRFWLHPAVWGSGERPLQGKAQKRLRLVGSEAFDSGVTLLRYAPIY